MDTRRSSRPRRGTASGRLRALIAPFAVASLALLWTASSALANLQQEYAKFADCPVENPNADACMFAQTTSGEFTIGSKTVPINKTITIQGGINTSMSPTTRSSTTPSRRRA
jgi:hypothetical protein